MINPALPLYAGNRSDQHLLMYSAPSVISDVGLPAKLASGCKVAFLGDSLIANYVQGLTGFTSFKVSTGFDTARYVLARRRNFNADTWSNPGAAYNGADGSNFGRGAQGFGANGNGALPGINSFIPELLTKNPALVVYAGGTNCIINKDDLQPGQPSDSNFIESNAAYIIGAIQAGITSLLAGGCTVIVATIPISGTYLPNSVNNTLRQLVNARIVSLHNPASKVFVWDRAVDFELPNKSQDLSKFQNDTIHLSSLGAYVNSLSLETLFEKIITSGDNFASIRSGTSLISTSTPPSMIGTSGTTGSATTVSGVIATGGSISTLNTGNASRIVCSKEVIGAGPNEKQVMAISPNGVSNTVTFLSQITSPAIVAGEWYQAFIEVEDNVAFGQLAWTHLQLRANITLGPSAIRCSSAAFQVYFADNNRLIGPSIGNSSTNSFLIVGCPVEVPPAVSFDRLRVELIVAWSATSNPFTIKIKQIGVFKIPSPKTIWNY